MRPGHLAFAAIIALLAVWPDGIALSASTSYAEIQRGKYLATAGDCIACHTAEPDKPFAGGRTVPTPFGTIYSANITPDPDTGIGAWTDDDFFNAMHNGVRPDGTRLYPAFPYPYFTHVSRDDVSAIRAYLQTLTPIRNRKPDNDLVWPLTWRFLLRGWNTLFFDEGEFRSDPQKPPEWNRGAYLVEGLGHCGACHTPKNLFGADENESSHLKGGEIQNWFAPQLSGDDRSGLGQWSANDLVEFLKTGKNRLTGATGLMAEVVKYSTSKLTDDDLRAIATYLKDQPGEASAAPKAPADNVMAAGKAIFEDSCAACHQAGGEGVPGLFPPLKGNANVQTADPTDIIHVILDGAETVPTPARPTAGTMPAFNWKLSDAEVAAVATYVRNSWGNSGQPVAADDAASLRDKLKAAAAHP